MYVNFEPKNSSSTVLANNFVIASFNFIQISFISELTTEEPGKQNLPGAT